MGMFIVNMFIVMHLQRNHYWTTAFERAGLPQGN
jgi:hypothetical protein